MSHSKSRRELLRMAALATTGAGVAAEAPPVAAQEQPEDPRLLAAPLAAEVIVVGAGCAGLAAAYALKKRGRSVLVLEADKRVGGRTLSVTLSNGFFVDLCAGWTGSTQPRTLRLVREMGLRTFAQPLAGDSLYVADDGTVTRYQGLVFPLSPGQQAELGGALLTLDAMAQNVDVDEPWKTPNAAELDAQTCGEWVRANIQDPTVRSVIMRNLGTVFGLDGSAVSLLHFLFMVRTNGGSIAHYGPGVGSSEEFRIDGGSQKLTLALAKRLGRAVRLNHPVRACRQDRTGVTVVAGEQALRCRRVIVTVPSCLTGFINFDPPLPQNRAQLIQRIPQGSVYKASVVYDTAFWRQTGLSGESFSVKSPITQTIDGGKPEGQNSPGVMVVIATDDRARDLAGMTRAERQQIVLNDLVARFGPAAATLSPTIKPNFVEFDTASAEWIRGDYAGYPGPHVWTASGFGSSLRPPTGRIHWAGVDTSTVWYGNMEGAIESGERAAAEVLDAF